MCAPVCSFKIEDMRQLGGEAYFFAMAGMALAALAGIGGAGWLLITAVRWAWRHPMFGG